VLIIALCQFAVCRGETDKHTTTNLHGAMRSLASIIGRMGCQQFTCSDVVGCHLLVDASNWRIAAACLKLCMLWSDNLLVWSFYFSGIYLVFYTCGEGLTSCFPLHWLLQRGTSRFGLLEMQKGIFSPF